MTVNGGCHSRVLKSGSKGDTGNTGNMKRTELGKLQKLVNCHVNVATML